MKIYIVALNRQQAVNYASETYTNNFLFLYDSVQLLGAIDPVVLFVRDWIKRKDLEDIFVNLLRSSEIHSTKHRTINQLWGEWKTYHASQFKNMEKYYVETTKVIPKKPDLDTYQLIQDAWSLGMTYGLNICKDNPERYNLARLANSSYLKLLKEHCNG
jgi:hypothetical protein